MHHLATYIAHVIIRGVIYRTIFHLPFVVVIVAAIFAARYIVKSRKGADK